MLELALTNLVTILIFGLIGFLVAGSITYAIAVVLVLKNIGSEREEAPSNQSGSDTNW